MSSTKYLGLCALVLALPGFSRASTEYLTLTPQPADLHDLDHSRVYTWGFEAPLVYRSELVGATLTFDNIRNWDNNPNVLYLHLLDAAPLGVQIAKDNEGGGDYFASFPAAAHRHLTTYANLPTTSQDLTYSFAAEDLAALRGYLADGHAGLGFDPDCHFYNDGVSLTLTYSPEPSAFGMAAVGAIMLRRRRKT